MIFLIEKILVSIFSINCDQVLKIFFVISSPMNGATWQKCERLFDKINRNFLSTRPQVNIIAYKPSEYAPALLNFEARFEICDDAPHFNSRRT